MVRAQRSLGIHCEALSMGFAYGIMPRQWCHFLSIPHSSIASIASISPDIHIPPSLFFRINFSGSGFLCLVCVALVSCVAYTTYSPYSVACGMWHVYKIWLLTRKVFQANKLLVFRDFRGVIRRLMVVFKDIYLKKKWYLVLLVL